MQKPEEKTGLETTDVDGASGNAAAESKDDKATDGHAGKRSHLARNLVIGIVLLAVVLAGAGVGAYAAGAIYPETAAAKYGAFDYLDESEVTDYIMTYKEQMGYGDAEDDDWAMFLATYNLTPDRLRLSTITQLLSDKAVEAKCAELGITVSDEEVDASVNTLKSMYGLLDDETWASTLELYGQTEDGLRDVYRLAILKQKLCTQEVETPVPSEDEVRAYIEDFAASSQSAEAANAGSAEEAEAIMQGGEGKLLRHSYCFVLDAAGDEVTLDESEQVELVRQEFIESGMDVENFVTLLSLYSNDEEAVANNGAMGWDADTSEYSETFARMLDTVEVGGVSSVFTDGDTVCFIWVDQGYTIPYAEEDLEALDLSAMPDSLYEYFSDCEAYLLWQEASDAYLADLVSDMKVTIYEMPADVPYNVDMSAYLVEEETTDSDSES